VTSTSRDSESLPSTAPPSPPPVRTVDLDWRSAATVAVLVLVMTAVVGMIAAATRSVTWCAIGGLLALALDPLVDRIQRRLSCRRTTAVGIVLAGFITVVVAIGLLLGPAAAREVQQFSRDLPGITRQLGDLPIIGDDLERADAPAKLRRTLEDLPEKVARDDDRLSNTARSIVDGTMGGLFTALVTISLLIDGERIIRRVRSVVPVHRRDQADRIGRLCYVVVGKYFAGSLFVAGIAGLSVLAVSLGLGVPLAPLLALWVAVFDLVPQIGGAVGGIPFVLLGFSQGVGVGVICLVFWILYLQFENHLLSPMVVGRAVDLSPPTTMMAALVGGAAAGVPGALVATPLIGTVKAVWFELRPPADGARPSERLQAEAKERADRPGLMERVKTRLHLA
jgi:predicted PurR-regulated permease PerM